MRALAVALVTVLAGAASAVAATPTFGPSYTYDYFASLPVGPGLQTADLDGNARADLLVPDASDVWILPGVETGFDPSSPLGPTPMTSSTARKVAVADFTKDGLDDIITFDEATDDLLLASADSFGLVIGCGCSGPFDIGDLAGGAGVLLAGGDLNVDGSVDVVVADNASDGLRIFRGDGDYTNVPTSLAGPDLSGASIDDVVVGNFDTGTARPEIAALRGTGAVAVFEDTAANLSFATSVVLAASSGNPAHRLAAGDVTGDGVADLVVSDPAAGRITVYPGGPSFGTAAPAAALAGASVLTTADVNADGRSEVISGTTANSVLHVLEGSTSGALTEVASVDSGGPAPTAVAAGDFNGDGRADLVGYYDTFGVHLTRNTSLPVSTAAGPGGFGSQTVGTIGAPRTVTITNSGAAPLRVTSVRSDSDDFIVSGESCVGAAIAAGAACSARVRFAPTAAGARAGTLTVAGNTAAPATVALSGTGAVPASGDSSNAGPPGPRGRRGAPGKRPNQPRARCRIRPARIQCVVYNAKTQPWRFTKLRTGRLGHRRVAPGRYRLTVIHADRDGRLRVYRRWVRVR